MHGTSPSPSEIDSLSDAERAALVERLCASLAHALADRLMVIAGRIELLTAKQTDADARRSLDEIRAQLAHVTEIVARARRFGENLRPPVAPNDVAEALAQVIDEIRPLADARRITIEAEPVRSFPVNLPSGALIVVLRALLGFVVARCAGGSTAEISVGVVPVERARTPTECVVVRLALPPGTSVPHDMRALVDPWLSEPEGDAKARLLLALGIGTVRDCGGWTSMAVEHGRTVLTVHWPVAETRTGSREARAAPAHDGR